MKGTLTGRALRLAALVAAVFPVSAVAGAYDTGDFRLWNAGTIEVQGVKGKLSFWPVPFRNAEGGAPKGRAPSMRPAFWTAIRT